MQYIQTKENLIQVFNSIQHCLLSNDTGDAVYKLTQFHQSYDDESQVDILTYGINQHQEVDLAELSTIIAEYLPKYLQKAFIQEEHLSLANGQQTLAIHFNDSTITIIYHCTGQF